MADYLGIAFIGLVALNMWALLDVLRSGRAWPVRIAWAAILICLPGIGFAGWFLAGPRAA